MKLYICLNCKNIVDRFKKVNPIYYFNRSQNHLQDTLTTQYQTKCTSCNTDCEFNVKTVYKEDSGRINNLGKEVFESKTVIRYTSMGSVKDFFSEEEQQKLKTKVQEFHQKKRKETEREEQTIIDERNNQIKKIKKQRQKESDEYWKGFISKYPLFGISNWLFGKKEITSTTKK